MQIKYSSVFVDDQAKALAFYTENLGFVTKADVSAGEYRWLTVVSPDTLDGVELLLEPNDNPAAKTFQAAIKEQAIAATMFLVEDVQQEYARLKALGVIFTMPPTDVGMAHIAVLDDTCGNLIQLFQPK